jgi:hypothetical protein
MVSESRKEDLVTDGVYGIFPLFYFFISLFY